MRDGRRDRDTVKGGRSSVGRTDEKLVLGPEWIETSFADLRVGDMVVAVVMRPFDDGQGGEKLLFTGVKTIPLRKGLTFEGRVVDDDWRGTPGNFLIERTGFPTRIDRRLIPPPVVGSFGPTDLEGRGTRLYRHRYLGPDRSKDDGFWLINRLREAAGGDDTDQAAVERLAGCLAPPTTVGAEPAPLGMYHARLMLEGDHPYSESVYLQVVAEKVRREADHPAQPAAPGRSQKTRTNGTTTKRTEPNTPARHDEVGSERRKRLGTYEGADAPLCLRFDTRPCWEALKAELGVTETGAAIVCDLYAEARTAGRSTSYSRTRSTYASRQASQQKWQKRTALATFDRILPQVDHLEAIGAITNWIAPPRKPWETEPTFQSTMRATPLLLDTMDRLIGGGMPLVPLRPVETVIMRDADGEPVAFRETRATERMRRNVEAINEGLLAMRMEGAFPAAAIRIGNLSLERGTRFYLEGGGIQVLPEARRLRITFGGERAAEVDYKCMHVSMLYARLGLIGPEDAYDIGVHWPRALVKVAMLAVLNAPTFDSALGAIACKDQMAALARPRTKAARLEAANLIAAIKHAHSPIARFFHSGVGAFLMREEADIMEKVQLRMLKAGDPVVPIHDSALCRASAAGTLEAAMIEVAEKAGIRGVRTDVSYAPDNDDGIG